MNELYEAVLAKAKATVEKEKETGLKMYHATRKERETANDPRELPPVIEECGNGFSSSG